MSETSVTFRLRMGLSDTHYADGLIPAASIMRLFADCASELGIRNDGIDGFLAAYENVEFLQPLYAGDYVEIRAELASVGNRSRRINVAAYRTVRSKVLENGLSGGTVLDPPELIAKALMVAVVPA